MFTVKAYAAPSATKHSSPPPLNAVPSVPLTFSSTARLPGSATPTSTPSEAMGASKATPCPPGHEIAGIVTEVGTAVTKHAVGDRVGVGCMVNSCRECIHCQAGEEQYCLAGITTFSRLNHWGAGPGKKVAIVGLGGLGHLAVKIAHAMGAEVTILS